IHDRDPRFTLAFRETLAAADVQVVRLPPRSPNLNAYAERFVRTIKESCLDRIILVGEASLCRLTATDRSAQNLCSGPRSARSSKICITLPFRRLMITHRGERRPVRGPLDHGWPHRFLTRLSVAQITDRL